MQTTTPKLAYKDWLINQKQPDRADSKRYVDFWLTHINYCKSGVLTGGIYFSGWLYWHLNFFKVTLDKLDEWGNETVEIGHPRFRDNEYYIDFGLNKAYSSEWRKPLMVFGSRRFAKSVFLASRISYKAFIFQNTHAIIVGASSADINNITKYFREFYSARPDCFADLRAVGNFQKTSSDVEIAYNRKDSKKEAKESGKPLNPISEKLFSNVNLNENKLIFSQIAVRNLEHGQVRSKDEMLAGITPTEVIFDECGKYLFEKQWLALEPALSTTRGTFRTIPLFSGCLTENNKVWDNQGNLVSIKDITKKTGILGYSEKTNEISQEEITYLQPPIEKECLLLKTNKGTYIECSTDHPILTAKNDLRRRKYKGDYAKRRTLEFKEAKDIKIGDSLAAVEEVPFLGNETMWQPYLVGMLVGDGSYGYDKTPRLSNEDKEVWDYVESLGYDIVEERSRVTDKGRLYRECRIKGICPNLRELGIYGQVKDQKDIPEILHNCKKEVIIEFLSGLFDADGYITKTHPSISLTTVSEKMSISLKLLLLKLGIVSTINRIKPDNRDRRIKSKNYTYCLHILGKKYVKKLYDQGFRFKIKRKQEILEKRVQEIINNPLTQHTNYPNIHYEKVIEITNVGIKPVFNLTAGTTNTYLAGGIITHNTGGDVDMSQDAEKYFLDSEKYGFTPISDDEYREIVNEQYFKHYTKNKKTGLFVPGQMAMVKGSNISKVSVPAKDYFKREYTKEEIEELEGLYIDVTDWDAINLFFKDYRKTLPDEKRIKDTMYYPQEPEDCFLLKSNNPFPVEEAKRTRVKLEENGLLGENVTLSKGLDGRIFLNETDKIPITDFPYKGGSYDAPCVILERPIKDEPKDIKVGSYVAGFDGYKMQQSNTTDSVGSFYIFKRIKTLKGYNRQIVAYLSTRPKDDKTFYRQVLYLLELYNAELLPEFDTNLYNYLSNANALHYLADCKGVVDRITPNSTAQTTAGLPATAPNKRHYLSLVKSYCWEEIVIGYDQAGEEIKCLGVETIHDPMLLKELEDFREGGNFDRIAAFGHALVWDEHLTLRGMNLEERNDGYMRDQYKVSILDSFRKANNRDRKVQVKRRSRRW